MSDRELLTRVAELPVGSCYCNETWQEGGLAQVVVLRKVPDGTYFAGAYLVDVFCLGVKNATSVRLEDSDVGSFLDSCPGGLRGTPYEDARSLILGAIEFARRFGFEPHESWASSSAIVEPDRPFNRVFEFGKDGQPFYTQGPDDDVQKIMNKLAPLIAEDRAQCMTADEVIEETDLDEWCEEIACLLDDRYFRDAKKEIEAMMESYPERWEPFYLKGTCLSMQGKFDQAIPLFEEAIAMEPSTDVYLNLAEAHRSLFHLEEWVSCLRKVVELDGESGRDGRVAKMRIDELDASIRESDGVSIDTYLALGRVYDQAFENLNSGEFDEAIDGFSEVLRVRPNHVQSHGNLGLAYAGKGNRDRALACLDRAIELDAEYQRAINNRRVLLAAPDVRHTVQSMRRVDFYEDQERARRTRRATASASGR
jgi:tetratricopeptide (TPR) repeat protein